MQTVLDAFEQHAGATPDAPAIHCFDDTISFGELNVQADRFAARLRSWGIGPGDRVAVSMQNDPMFAVARYGAWKRGAIFVPLNPMFREKELAYHLQDSGARVWIGLDSLYTDEARRAIAASSVEHAAVQSDPALMDCAPQPGDRIPSDPGAIAELVYTSGTTGSPKGSMNLHRNIAWNSEVFRTWMEIGPDDVIAGLAPLFHVTGLVAQLALSGWAGIPLVLFHRFEAEQAIHYCRKWRATFSVATITAYIAMMNARGDGGPNFLPKCYSGGAPVAPSLTTQFRERFGSYIHNIYGLTESNSPSHATPLREEAPVDPSSGALSIGKTIPGCEAKIVSLDDPGRELPDGEIGELAMRGPMIFAGYWNKPEETERAFHDGWFRTGDVAFRDDAGWYYLVDRKKDMIIASGFKIWPREVEDVLYQHPAVREAAVIGVPDSYRGETVKAFIALKNGRTATPEEIIAFCRDRIAAYKVPRAVEFIPELPKTATGKFLRRALRG